MRQIGLKYGALLGFFTMAYSALLTTLGKNDGILAYLPYLFILIFIALAFKECKKFQNGTMSFGQGFQIGLWVVLVLSLLAAIFTFVHLDVVNPALISQIEQEQTIALEKYNYSDEEIRSIMQMMKVFMTPANIASMVFLGYMFFGLFASLIMALIFRKNAPEF